MPNDYGATKLQRPLHGRGNSVIAGNLLQARDARQQGQANMVPMAPMANPQAGGGMNQFFRDAALMNQPDAPMPQGGVGLGGLLALQFINQNPALKKAFELQLQRMLVPQSAQRPQPGQMDQSLAAQLAMSQGLPQRR